MMKINLSGDKEEKKSEETIATASPTQDSALADEITDESENEIVEDIKPADNKKRQTILLGVLLLVVVVAAGYLYKDKILSYFPRETEVVEPVVVAPPPPEPEVIETEPDPAFVTMNRIGESVSPGSWLTSALIKYDGSFQIKGMAFSHKSMMDMVSLLEKTETITSRNIPGKAKSAETRYNYSISGILSDADVPEILDTIPTEDLVALGEAVRSREKELGIKFSRLPKAGAVYSEKDMPFALVGSYEGLLNVISTLCPEDGDKRVFSLSIAPAGSGRVFDKIRASFSLRSVSSI